MFRILRWDLGRPRPRVLEQEHQLPERYDELVELGTLGIAVLQLDHILVVPNQAPQTAIGRRHRREIIARTREEREEALDIDALAISCCSRLCYYALQIIWLCTLKCPSGQVITKLQLLLRWCAEQAFLVY